jgi:immune inhibitor A
VRRLLAIVFATLIVISAFGGSSAGVVVGGAGAKGQAGGPSHQGKAPKIVRKWQGDKATAADLVARGKATVDAQGRVKLPNGRFIDYRTDGVDKIVTLLVEFTDPLHNMIPAPDRAVDNTTYWLPDFDPASYTDMLYTIGGNSTGLPSMADYYLEQSSGRYTVTGQVSDWVRVPYPESEFGADATYGGDEANGPVYRIVDAALKAAMEQDGAIDWSPSMVDIWDRYDCDGDGNYGEPDGYVDHLQLVHAGIDQSDGGGAQGSDAIWAHSWYANYPDIGLTGPAGCQLGGYPVGDTGLWAGDYTIQSENGGVGVFAHEFGHDLGLPDLYDTEGWNDNSVSFWDLMSDGSNVSSPDVPHIGTQPTHMGAWDKLVLGWLDKDLATLKLGDDKRVTLGPAEGRTAGAYQALRVNLPDYTMTTTVFPVDGPDPYYYYSTQGNDIDTTMRRALPSALAAPTTLTFRAIYDIEVDWDYAYVQYSTDGVNWENADGNLSTTTSPNGQNFGYGITGTSGGWVTGTYTIPAGATHIGFRYWTDGAVVGQGFAVDSISLGGGTPDDGSMPGAWTFGGFMQTTNGQFSKTYFHYYLAESRSYVRSDTALCGAYLFITDTMVDKECYADGVLIWYRDSAYADNNVSAHPGHGNVLVVDSHPAAMPLVVGKGWIRERWQTWDSSFTLKDHQITLTSYRGAKLYSRTYLAPKVPLFHDSGVNAYYDPRVPYSSVKLPGSGLKIQLLSVSPDGTKYQVRVCR